MLATERGAPAPERQRGRLSLKTWRPRKSALLGGDEQSDNTDSSDPSQDFETFVWRAVNRWDVGRRGLGLIATGGRIRKADANHELKKALKALAGGDA